MVSVITPIRENLNTAPVRSTRTLCPLCGAYETTRCTIGDDVEPTAFAFGFACMSKLVQNTDGTERMTQSDRCTEGHRIALLAVLREIAEQAEYAPPSIATLEHIETIARTAISEAIRYSTE